MKKWIRLIKHSIAIAAIGLMMAGTASAVQITGDIVFAGIADLNPTPATATSIDFINPFIVGVGTLGDYAGALGLPATFTDFTFNPFLAPVVPLWTFNWFGNTYSFDLNALTSVTNSGAPGSLNLTGAGTLFITGFDPTPGIFSFSSPYTNPNQLLVTFAASNTAVPEPGTILLLGSGLVGLAFYGKRRQRTA